MKKYLYIFLGLVLLIFVTYFWYIYSQNQKMQKEISNSYLIKAEDAQLNSEIERIKYGLNQELENCRTTLSQKEGNFGEYEYCQKYTEFINKLNIQ